MIRSVGAVAIGLVAWIAMFFALAFLLAAVWPDYGAHGRDWFGKQEFTFTSTMACLNLVLWALAEFTAGWVTMKISRRRGATWILAAILFIYLAVIHLLLEWSRFPWWYNLGVVIPCMPAILLGGRCAADFPSTGHRSVDPSASHPAVDRRSAGQ